MLDQQLLHPHPTRSLVSRRRGREILQCQRRRRQEGNQLSTRSEAGMGGTTLCRARLCVPEGSGSDRHQVQIRDHGSDNGGTGQERLASRDRCGSGAVRLLEVQRQVRGRYLCYPANTQLARNLEVRKSYTTWRYFQLTEVAALNTDPLKVSSTPSLRSTSQPLAVISLLRQP
jgi:hypothetical protein